MELTKNSSIDPQDLITDPEGLCPRSLLPPAAPVGFCSYR